MKTEVIHPQCIVDPRIYMTNIVINVKPNHPRAIMVFNLSFMSALLFFASVKLISIKTAPINKNEDPRIIKISPPISSPPLRKINEGGNDAHDAPRKMSIMNPLSLLKLNFII